MFRKVWWWLVLIVFLNIPMFSQQDTLTYEVVDEKGSKQTGKIKDPEQFIGSLNNLLDSLNQRGYWNSNVDQLNIDELEANIYKGQKFGKLNIERGQLSQDVYNRLKLERCTSPVEWMRYGTRLSEYMGELGYPFASIQLDSVTKNDDDLYAQIKIDKGKLIKFDSVYWKGDLRLRPAFLMHYLDVESGAPYKHSSMVNAEKLLKALPFVELKSSPQLKFLGPYASLHLELDKRNASRFDFLIGVNPLNEMGETRFFVTLDFEAELTNQLNYGEWIRFRFARLRPENQEIEFAARYPYLLNLPVALTGKFNLYRRSLEFQDLIAEAGADYLINSFSSIGLSWTYKASRLIEIDSAGLLSKRALPENLDVVKNGISIRGDWKELDQLLNPTKGWDLDIDITGRTKSIIENNTILGLKNEQVDFANSYDTLNTSGFQVALKGEIHRYFPIGSNFSLNSYLNAFYLFSDIEIYNNELARIGGNKLLRGFDEESIQAQAYLIPGLALHVLLDEYSFLSLPFFDFALIQNGDDTWTTAYGIGAGISFRTRVGMLNFSIATGKMGDEPFDIGRPKAHVGFLSIF